jgi:hypothetical protein
VRRKQAKGRTELLPGRTTLGVEKHTQGKKAAIVHNHNVSQSDNSFVFLLSCIYLFIFISFFEINNLQEMSCSYVTFLQDLSPCWLSWKSRRRRR